MALADTALLNLAFILSWWMRYELELGPAFAEQNYVSLGAYLSIQLSLTLIVLLVYKLQGLYRPHLEGSWVDEVAGIFAGTTIGVAIMIVAVFYYRPYALSRLMFIYAWLLIIVLLGLSRLVERTIRAYLRRKGIGLEHVLIVGAGRLGRMIMQSFVAQPELGYQVIGFVDDERQKDIGRFPCLGRLSEITRALHEHDIDQVVIALPSASHRRIIEILTHCERAGVGFRIVPDFYELSLSQVDIDVVNGIPLIGVKEVSIRGMNLLLKRLTDVVLSALVLVMGSWLLALIALAIRLDSTGPVLFKQVRVSRGGKPFVLYKFRSMKVGADEEIGDLRPLNEASGPLFKIRCDPRLTRVGRFLRRFSLDELPQFYNVLRGDMSLVGPRPPLSSEVERYEDWQRKRLEVSPGLTGLWQVSGRSDLTFDEMVLLDIWYIENWSLGLDFRVLLRTIPAVLSGKGAY